VTRETGRGYEGRIRCLTSMAVESEEGPMRGTRVNKFLRQIYVCIG